MFKKHQGEAPPKPIRGKKIDARSTESSEVGSDDEKPAYEVNIRDIVPRVDITPQITDALINELADKDWKVCNTFKFTINCFNFSLYLGPI